MRVRVFVRAHECVYVNTRDSAYLCVCACMCMCVCEYVRTCVCECVCVYVYVRAWAGVRGQVGLCVGGWVYVV